MTEEKLKARVLEFAAEQSPKLVAGINDGLILCGLDMLTDREKCIIGLLSAQMIAMTVGIIELGPRGD